MILIECLIEYLNCYFMIKGKEIYNIDEQHTLADRLAHRPAVAKQSYQACTSKMAAQGSSLIGNLTKNSTALDQDGLKEKSACVTESLIPCKRYVSFYIRILISQILCSSKF